MRALVFVAEQLVPVLRDEEDTLYIGLPMMGIPNEYAWLKDIPTGFVVASNLEGLALDAYMKQHLGANDENE